MLNSRWTIGLLYPGGYHIHGHPAARCDHATQPTISVLRVLITASNNLILSAALTQPVRTDRATQARPPYNEDSLDGE